MNKLNSNNLLIIIVILSVLAIISYTNKPNSDYLVIIISILGVLATVYCWSGVHDFSASVDPMLVNIYQGSTAPHITVKVDSGLLYHKDVSLRSEFISPYIHVLFTPEILKSGDKSPSQVIISAEKETLPGEYLVPIVSIGADGKEHTCKFKLKVLSSSALIPTPTPTEATTSENSMLVDIDRGSTTHLNKLNLNHLLIMIVIIGVLTIIYSWSGVHDFSASVDPILVNVYQGGTAHIMVKVASGLLYHEDIRLSEESVPSYIHVIFTPEILKSGYKSFSQIIISAEKEAPPGEYLVPIVSTGADGKEHVSEIKLKVLSSSEIPTATEIRITSPSNKATVNKMKTIYGIAGNVPDGSHVWILYYSYSTNKYYPRLIDCVLPRGNWWIPLDFRLPNGKMFIPLIDTVDDSDKKYEIIAVLADIEANEKLKYITNCEQNDNWPGIEEIPAGATIYDQITVTIE